jgi:hypothetical protein
MVEAVLSMTVITTFITKHGIVHATDSLLTIPEGNKLKAVEHTRPKLVIVRDFRGVMSFWGMGKIGSSYTVDWLQEEVSNARQYATAEEFVQAVAHRLNNALVRVRFPRGFVAGIGIHFTAYERVQNYWIPELFLISNYVDLTYQSLRSDGVGVGRQTYKTTFQAVEKNDAPARPEHREEEYRLYVYQFLQNSIGLTYNNGDPELFNKVAGAITPSLATLAARGVLRKSPDIAMFRNLALRTIEIVADIQTDFGESGTQRVGGKLHNISITPYVT